MQRTNRWACLGILGILLAALSPPWALCWAGADGGGEEPARPKQVAEKDSKSPRGAEEKEAGRQKPAKKQARAPRDAKKQGDAGQTADEQAKMLEKMNAAFAKMTPAQIQQIQKTQYVAQFLPGHDALYYVLVLRGSGQSGGKRQTVALCAGKTAAAKAIADFLDKNPHIVKNPRSYSRWLQLEMYPNQVLAATRYRALVDYAWRSGYR